MVCAGKSSSWRAARRPNGICCVLWAQLDSDDRDFVARRSIMSPGRVNAWIEVKLLRLDAKKKRDDADKDIGR